MRKTTIDFKTSFGTNFVLGTVVNIDLEEKFVVVDTSNDVIRYTDLVIAVGCIGPFPGKIFAQKADDAARRYKEAGDQVTKTFMLEVWLPLRHILLNGHRILDNLFQSRLLKLIT